MLRRRRAKATSEIAQALHCSAGETVLNVMLVHCEDEKPIQLEDRFVSPAFAPHLLEQDFYPSYEEDSHNTLIDHWFLDQIQTRTT